MNEDPITWSSATHVGDSNEFQDSWLAWSSPKLVVAFKKLNTDQKTLSLFPSLCLTHMHNHTPHIHFQVHESKIKHF